MEITERRQRGRPRLGDRDRWTVRVPLDDAARVHAAAAAAGLTLNAFVTATLRRAVAEDGTAK